MKYCENCRVYINDEKMVYCGICRSQMTDVDPNTLVFTADDYICPNCGYMYRENIGNCSFCGAELVPLGAGGPEKAIENNRDQNNKKKKAIISVSAAAAALALLILGLLLSGALKKRDVTVTPASTTAAAESEPAGETGTAPQETTTEAPEGIGVTLQKAGEIGGFYRAGEGGLLYRDAAGNFGVLSLDGKKDTGTLYTHAAFSGRYFTVTEKQYKDEKDIAGMNATGLIDGSGRELIPAGYAVVKKLNDRFWQAYKITEKTDADDYLISLANGIFSVGSNVKKEFPRYKGTWAVYDVVAGQPVPGVTGTNNKAVYAYGSVIRYVTDGGERVAVNEKGERLPEKAEILDNGCYYLPEGNEYVVFDAAGSELFRCASNGYVPCATPKKNDAYLIAKKTGSGGTKYVLTDLTGKVLSFEFNSYSPCTVWGNLIFVDGGLFDFSGRRILDGSVAYSEAYTCKNRDCGLLLHSKGLTDCDLALVDSAGETVWTGRGSLLTTATDVYADTSRFLIRNKSANGNAFFCWKDRDFTITDAINCSSAGEADLNAGLVPVKKDNNTYDLTDTVTGETLLSGYKSYAVGGNTEDGVYVYATMADDAVEIYKMQ